MFDPEPIDISGVKLSDEQLTLAEKIAENNHNIWAKKRIAKGWSFGFEKNEERKESPVLMPFEELPESEKTKRINIAAETIRAMLALGCNITCPGQTEFDETEENVFDDPELFEKIEEDSEIICLSDDDGNQFHFELLGEVELDSRNYAVFLPIDSDEEESGLEIFVEVTINGEKTYSYINNDSLIEQVISLFEEKYKDKYDFD